MRSLLLVAAGVALLAPSKVWSQYTFGDWASDQGYSPGAVMPDSVNANASGINSLYGVDQYDWNSTPTEFLNLSQNQLSSLEPNTFSSLSVLQSLWLQSNEIGTIETGAFNGLSHLTELTLSGNQYETVETGDFDGLPNLEFLVLYGSQISSIEPDSFDGLENLTRLWLSDNQLVGVEAGDFNGLISLKELQLYRNHISSIDAGDFSGLPKLEILRLYENDISRIELGAFGGLENLKELWLDRNRISSIPSGAFSGLPNVEYLYLGGNEALSELNFDGANFTGLTKGLDLEGNNQVNKVLLRNARFSETSLGVLLDGGSDIRIGIGEINGITMLDLSGVDLADINDLSALYALDDLTDLWIANTSNLDAYDLDMLLNNLATIEATSVEGVLYLTPADFDAYNEAGGGLLAAWDAEPGHHVEFVSAGLPGDFNGDGVVDGVDFLAMQRGDPSAAKLALWEENFGRTLQSPAKTGVPEPASCVIAAIALLAACGYGLKQRPA